MAAGVPIYECLCIGLTRQHQRPYIDGGRLLPESIHETWQVHQLTNVAQQYLKGYFAGLWIESGSCLKSTLKELDSIAH